MREDLIGEPFRMFDFTPVGATIALAGVVFLAFGYRLLPAAARARPRSTPPSTSRATRPKPACLRTRRSSARRSPTRAARRGRGRGLDHHPRAFPPLHAIAKLEAPGRRHAAPRRASRRRSSAWSRRPSSSSRRRRGSARRPTATPRIRRHGGGGHGRLRRWSARRVARPASPSAIRSGCSRSAAAASGSRTACAPSVPARRRHRAAGRPDAHAGGARRAALPAARRSAISARRGRRRYVPILVLAVGDGARRFQLVPVAFAFFRAALVLILRARSACARPTR